MFEKEQGKHCGIKIILRFLRPKNLANHLLKQHFAPTKLERLITARRTSPVTARVDLQRALEKLFSDRYAAQFVGIHAEYSHETLSFAHMSVASAIGAVPESGTLR